MDREMIPEGDEAPLTLTKTQKIQMGETKSKISDN